MSHPDKRRPLSADLRELETALLEHPSVSEAAILRREDSQGRTRLVAYIVPRGSFSADALKTDLDSGHPGLEFPDAYVPVAALPLDDVGATDEARLSAIEVIDDDLIDRWCRALTAPASVDRAEVLVRERVDDIPYLHRLDLLPPPKDAVRPAETSDDAFDLPSGATGDRPDSDRPAISHGDPAPSLPDGVNNLADMLERAVRLTPEISICCLKEDESESELSYRELLDKASRVLAGLRSLGLAPGDKVIFQLDDHHDFLVSFWGCVLGGIIPVPVSIAPVYEPSNSVVRKLYNAWKPLGKPPILTGRSLAGSLRSVLESMDVTDARVETVEDLLSAKATTEWHQSRPDDLALLLLTSGSTGAPKAVMLRHANLMAMSQASSQTNGFTDRDVSLNWMPLDHVAGLVLLHLRDVFACCRQIQIPTTLILQDPLKWLDYLDRFGATATFAPNFAFGLINDRSDALADRHWDLKALRFISNAGEAIVAKTARRFLTLLRPHGLPPTAMYPAWGMSETSSATTYWDNFLVETSSDDDPFVEVGGPLPGFSMRIVDSHGELVTEGRIGHLEVTGSTVFAGYYQNEEQTEKAFADDGWFKTGDLGYIRDGRLTIAGRQKDEIIINGVNYYSHDIESVAEEIPGVEPSFTAACAVRLPHGSTEVLAVFFNPSRWDDERLLAIVDKIRTKVGSDVGIVPACVVPLEKDQVPKTVIGKIQRLQLKDRFAAGEFNDTLKRVDILSRNANTIPDWFVEKVWYRKEPIAPCDTPVLQNPLIFADRTGLGTLLWKQLREAGQACTLVEPGSSFSASGPDCYAIDPTKPDHYKQLVSAVTESGLPIDQIVHLWTYQDTPAAVAGIDDLRKAQNQGLYSLLFLVQALAEVHVDEKPVRLDVFGSRTQIVSPSDPCIGPHSTLLGLLKSVPLELPWLSCRHVDLEVSDPEFNVERILRELQVSESEDEVAYRDGRRLVWGLSKVDMPSIEPGRPPIEEEGLYLITGGLGGVGSALAKRLIEEHRAKLILTGTTTLPDRSVWPACQQRGGKLADRIRCYLEIEAAGGDFIYRAVDVADLPAIEDTLKQAEQHFQQPLAGVFHLAGDVGMAEHWNAMDRHRAGAESVETFEKMFQSKVYGTWALYELLKDRPDVALVSFSSAIYLFGGASFSAYTAAQCFLSSYCLSQRVHSHPRSYCYAWSVWDEIGGSKGNPAFVKDLIGAVGYDFMSAQQGLDSLVAALYRNQPELVIGLDAGNRNVKRRFLTALNPLSELAAYYTVRQGESSDVGFDELQVEDAFGARSRCRIHRVDSMPLTDSGRIDTAALLSTSTAGRKTVPLATETEERIAAVWREVLGLRQVGAGDQFFQLGGNSLSATQVISRIQQEFRADVTLRDFFKSPTVTELAALIDELSSCRVTKADDTPIARTAPETLPVDVDGLSDEQVAAMLAEMQRKEGDQ